MPGLETRVRTTPGPEIRVLATPTFGTLRSTSVGGGDCAAV